MNVSGAGINLHAKNKSGAIALLEWLAGSQAQSMLAGLNMEFPVNNDVTAVPQVLAWGPFKADTIALSRIAEKQVAAVKLIDQAAYQ